MAIQKTKTKINIDKITTEIWEFGVTLFVGISLLFSTFSLMFILLDKGLEVPKFFAWVIKGFSCWLGILLLLYQIRLWKGVSEFIKKRKHERNKN